MNPGTNSQMNDAKSGSEPASLLVVGGQSRSVGKTSLVVELIRAFPQVAWLAMKITQYGHGMCTRNDAACGCAPREHTLALAEESDLTGRSDTSRFLAAGARRSLWLRTKQGHLAEAMPLVRGELNSLKAPATGDSASFAIVESNSLLGFLRPLLYLVVLDPAVEDFKSSASRYLDRADAFVLRAPAPNRWPPLARPIQSRPTFLQRLGEPLPSALAELVSKKVLARAQSLKP